MNRSSAKPVHCVIFGASSAIAAACGEIWARRQASLVLVGRSADKLERLKAHLQVCGASVVQVICQDLGDMTKHQSLVAELTAAGQTLDVVLLAHGTLGNQETAAVHAAAMLDIMRDNALSQMSLITHLTPILERQGRGALGVITSVAGDRGRPSNYVYGAAKGAVSIFLSGLRGRLYQRGVAVVDIRPGFVATPMTAHLKQGALFVRPEGVARGIVKAMDFGCSVVYLPWFWRYIMLTMLALGAGAQKSIEASLSSLGTNLLVLRPGSTQQHGVQVQAGTVTRFTIEDAAAITTMVPGVEGVNPSVTGRGQVVAGNKNWNTMIIGAGEAYPNLRAAKPKVGRFFTAEEDRSRARVAVIGRTVARELFGTANPLGESIKINRVTFQVIGILPEKGGNAFMDQDDVVVIPVNTAMKRLLGKEYVDSIDIKVVDPKKMQDVSDRTKSLMIARHRLRSEQDQSFQIRNMADIQEAMSSTSRIMSLLLASIASISLLVGGIGIMNIMLVSVTERTREIGLRKALGATRGNIMAQFLVESSIISLMGGLLGVALGYAISEGIATFLEWAVEVSLKSVSLAALFSISIGIIFGLWPARAASRLHPIEALRHE